MKHSGKAQKAAIKLIVAALLIVLAIYAVGIIAQYVHAFINAISFLPLALWVAFTVFTIYFFRDPDPIIPSESGVVVSPGHGTVDVIEDFAETEFMGGKCKRISIFLSPLNIHVQNAVISARIGYLKHNTGKFISAMRTDCGLENENVLIGFESSETPGQKIGVRLIAGVLARRIIPFVKPDEKVERGDRISLIQFGSRCDIYLPYGWVPTVKIGDKVRGGETIIARQT